MSPQRHPILDLCLDQLAAGKAEPIELKAEARAAIAGALEKLAGSHELIDAVVTLVEFAHYLRQQKASPVTAQALLVIVAETSTGALAALGRAGAKVADELQAGLGAEAAKRLLGSAPQAFEAKSGHEPPRGVFNLLKSTKK